MRSLLMLLLFSSLVVLQTNSTNALQDSNEEKMKKMIEHIIKDPAMMIETMTDNKTIDCSKILKEFREEEKKLISFTLEITYLRFKKFNYVTIEKYQISDSKEYHYYLFYRKDEEIIKFLFQTESDTILFKGISRPVE